MGRERRIRKIDNAQRDLNKMFELFIAEKQRNSRSPETIRSYVESQKRFMDFLEDNSYSIMSKDVVAEYVDDYTDYLQNDDSGEAIKTSSVNHYLRETRAFLYWCQDHCGMERFPVQLIKEVETIKETFTLAEQKKLIRKPESDASYVEWRSWAITNWVLGTGNRANTICNMRVGDVKFATNEIHLVKTKNKREQMVPLSKELRGVIALFIQMWRADADDDDYLFCNVSADKLTSSALKQSFRDYALARGIEKTSIHVMRHTFAKAWMVNGGEITRLQILLGHKTLEMTRHYVNLLVSDLKPNFSDFNPLDNLKKKDRREQRVTRSVEPRKRIVRRTVA